MTEEIKTDGSAAARRSLHASRARQAGAAHVYGDAWMNSRNRMGTTADPVIRSVFVRGRNRTGREEAEALYERDWLSARVINLLPGDATRNWIRLTHDKDPDKAEALRREDERLDGRGVFREGMAWGRLHGTALLVIGAFDGNAPEEPLDLGRVKSIAYTNVIDRWLTFPQSFYRDPEEELFGRVEVYRVHRLSVIGSPTSEVHETRTIRFDGNPLPPLARTRNFGWNASVFDNLYDALRNWGISNQAAASVIPAFITFAVKISNLQELISSKDFDTVQMRLAEFHAQMAVHNIAMYGEGESVEKMGTPITGLPDLMDKFMEIVSGAADIPKSILFQASSGQLGGSSAGVDQENWDRKVAVHQEVVLRPKVRRWLDVIGAPIGLEPGEVEFEFVPLTQMTATQEAELYAKVMTADQTAANAGLVDSPERLGVLRFGGDKFNASPPTFDTSRMEKFLDDLDAEPMPTPEDERQQQLEEADAEGDEGPDDDRLDDDRLDAVTTPGQRGRIASLIGRLGLSRVLGRADAPAPAPARADDGELEITAWREADGTMRARVKRDV